MEQVIIKELTRLIMMYQSGEPTNEIKQQTYQVNALIKNTIYEDAVQEAVDEFDKRIEATQTDINIFAEFLNRVRLDDEE